MKRIVSLLLALSMLVFGTAFAEEIEILDETPALTEEFTDEEAAPEEEYVPVEYDYDTLKIGSTTKLSGDFFNGMWSDNTSDLDVMLLLHGYNLVQWDNTQGGFVLDETVTAGIVATENSKGDRTYNIALNPEMTYCDGTPITAKDYIFSILLNMAPEIAEIGGLTGGANYIVGAEEYETKTAPTLTGVRLLNDHQFSIQMKAENYPFFYEMAMLSFYPFPISVIAPGCEIADDGNGVYIRNIDETVQEPIFTAELLRETVLNPETGYLSHPSVTSGPYKLVSFDGVTAEFEINKYYNGDRNGVKPTIKHLTFTVAENETMVEQLEAGEFGLLNKCVNSETVRKGMSLIANGYYKMSNYARTGLSYMAFCCEQPAVSSDAVRRAIACCFDKDEAVNRTVGNFGLRSDGYYGLGQWMYLTVNGTLTLEREEPGEDATEEEKLAYEEEMLAWDEMSLDDVAVYNLDLDAAAEYLAQDGWTKNADGGEFDPAADKIRCKEIDGELVALDLNMIYPEGNAIGDCLQETFVDNLAQVGIALTVTPVPMDELLSLYYRQQDRDCDLIYLATNFNVVFDPSVTFSVADASIGESNRTGILDEELYNLAVDMRRTEPGDTLSYCRKWIEFQKRFADVLPIIPVYSNVYFDFYTAHLQNYDVTESISWADEILGCVMDEIPAEEEEEPDEEVDGEVTIIE